MGTDERRAGCAWDLVGILHQVQGLADVPGLVEHAGKVVPRHRRVDMVDTQARQRVSHHLPQRERTSPIRCLEQGADMWMGAAATGREAIGLLLGRE